MSKPTLFDLKRQLEIVLEAFQAIEGLARENYEACAAPEFAKAMVPINFQFEDILKRLDDHYLKPERKTPEQVMLNVIELDPSATKQ